MRACRHTAAIGVAVCLVATSTWAGGAELDFVTRAANGDLMSLTESRLALDRSHDPKVRSFAQRLIDQHGFAEAGLQAAAAGSGAAVPTALDAGHQERVAALQAKSGLSFDTSYVADQIEVHSNALTLYADYMLLGDEAKLKAYAVRMIPITQAQFTDAQTLSAH